MIIKNYEELTLNSLKICSLIDQELFKIDNNFNQLNWKIFNDFHYCIKITYDQLIYYSELLSVIISKFPVQEIVLSESSHIIFDKKIDFIRNKYFRTIN